MILNTTFQYLINFFHQKYWDTTKSSYETTYFTLIENTLSSTTKIKKGPPYLIKEVLHKFRYPDIVKMPMNKQHFFQMFKFGYCIVTISCSLTTFFSNNTWGGKVNTDEATLNDLVKLNWELSITVKTRRVGFYALLFTTLRSLKMA